jgi:hypothetical protein
MTTHYEQALEAASKELGRPATDWAVEKLGSLRLMLAVERHRWSHNQTSATARSMIDLMGEISSLLKEVGPAEEIRININTVKTAVGIGHVTCPECGHRSQHRFEDGTLEPLPPKPPVEQPAIADDAAPVAPASPPATAAPVPAKVVPLIDYSPTRRHNGDTYNPLGSEFHKGGY